MIKIGKIELGKIPRIAVSIADRENNKLIKPAFVDIVEIRVDEFKKTDPLRVRNVVKIRRKIGLPLILTVRDKEEGGEKEIADGLKLSIFKECIPLVNAVDIELNSPILSEVIKTARKNKLLTLTA